MTVAEFENALDRLIEDYTNNPGNGTLDDIAWLLENTAKGIREGDYDEKK